VTFGRCNAYGAENRGGTGNPYGGLVAQEIAVQPECHAPAVHRFAWVCEHGHKGDPVGLCEMHWAEFSGRRSAMFEGGEGQWAEFNGRRVAVPWNLRRDVTFCPRCAAEAPECDNPEHARMMRGRPGRCGCRQHKCHVRLELVS
jgi:hypothetical protein